MAEKLVPLIGSVPKNSHRLDGSVDPHERIEVTVKLRRKSQSGLPTLDEFVAGQRAARITRAELAERYGAAQEDVAAVHGWAVQSGLSVSRVDHGSRQMHLVGSADAMSRAFGVELGRYMHARTGTHFRCPKSDVRVPENLASIITVTFRRNGAGRFRRNGATGNE